MKETEQKDFAIGAAIFAGDWHLCSACLRQSPSSQRERRKYMSRRMVLSWAAAVALFIVWSIMAYAQRGYFAVGGEYGAFLLPLFVAAIGQEGER